VDTLFAPAERSGSEENKRSFEALKALVPYDLVLDLMPNMAFILNARRQVIFANAAALSSLGLESEDVLGARPGEIMSCVHSREMPGGCGTSESCRVCGAVGAVLEAFEKDQKTARECRISAAKDAKAASLDLLVTASPISSPGGKYVLVTLADISDTKRRQALERIFFHDLMNSVTNLQACVILIRKEFGSAVGEHDYFGRLASTAKALIDEVCQQRDLMTMESGDLEADLAEIELSRFARELARGVEVADYAIGRRLVLEPAAGPTYVESDRALLGRVVVNMLKNAFEASAEGGEVVMETGESGGKAAVRVRNSAYIPREAQLQIFQRSFSTKGRGRGLGTYSMKMLTEEYLGGEIGFVSDPAGGTVFTVTLPLARP
jgi:nitrogen fixation/metabolism regulation signal transduction histidine kinase